MSNVIACPQCDQHYRNDRDCPNCSRQQRIKPIKPPKYTIRTFNDQLHDRTTLRAWFTSRGYMADIEADWPKLAGRLRRYNLLPVRWAEAVVRRDGCCHICNTQLHPLKLCIDHDHVSGRVRGLLCQRCNTGIGMLRIDGPDGYARAVAVRNYLDQPRVSSKGIGSELNRRYLQ